MALSKVELYELAKACAPYFGYAGDQARAREPLFTRGVKFVPALKQVERDLKALLAHPTTFGPAVTEVVTLAYRMVRRTRRRIDPNWERLRRVRLDAKMLADAQLADTIDVQRGGRRHD
jgi:hypothetical protein